MFLVILPPAADVAAAAWHAAADSFAAADALDAAAFDVLLAADGVDDALQAAVLLVVTAALLANPAKAA